MSDQERFEYLIKKYKPIPKEQLIQLREHMSQLAGKTLDKENLRQLLEILADNDVDKSFLNILVISCFERVGMHMDRIKLFTQIFTRATTLEIMKLTKPHAAYKEPLDEYALHNFMTEYGDTLVEIMVLIEAGNVDINRLQMWSHGNQYSPLGMAIMYYTQSGNRELLDYLLANGADIDAIAYRDSPLTPTLGDRTAICLAAEANHPECVNLFIAAGADVNKSFDDAVMTPLYAAAAVYRGGYYGASNQFDRFATVHPLLDNGADLFAAIDKITTFFEPGERRAALTIMHNLIATACKHSDEHSDYTTTENKFELSLLRTLGNARFIATIPTADRPKLLEYIKEDPLAKLEASKLENPDAVNHLFCKALIHNCTNIATTLMEYDLVDVKAVYKAMPHDTNLERTNDGQTAIMIMSKHCNQEWAKAIRAKISDDEALRKPPAMYLGR